MKSLIENKWYTILVLIALAVVAAIPVPENYEGITGEFHPLAIPISLGLLIGALLLSWDGKTDNV